MSHEAAMALLRSCIVSHASMYEAGRRAFQDGIALSMSPRAPMSREAWENGWVAASKTRLYKDRDMA